MKSIFAIATVSALRLASDPIPTTPTPVEKRDCTKEFFKPWDEDVNGYKRVVPTHFNGEGASDDRFMWNLHKNYAWEGKNKDCSPNGQFWMDRMGARTVAKEVLMNNVGMDAAKAEKHLADHFEQAWGHEDVNNTGVIHTVQMHTFMKFLAGEPFIHGLHAQV